MVERNVKLEVEGETAIIASYAIVAYNCSFK
jgi:hypothetical protein